MNEKVFLTFSETEELQRAASELISTAKKSYELRTMRKFSPFVAIILAAFCLQCYHPPGVHSIRNVNAVEPRTLFIAMDGVDYALMKELHQEGHFKDFLPPIPFISTFPSDTTVGFTGIMQPIHVGRVAGYEVRYYSYKKNRIEGGTPFDIYKIPIHYKEYFDAFRHQMHEKAIMYIFPGVAGKQDLEKTEQTLYATDKKFLMTYLGGTDGSSHVLGRKRTKHFLIYMDWYLHRMQERYRKAKGEDLRIVLFSDHGFHHHHLKTISETSIARAFKPHGFHLTSRVTNDNDVVIVPFGLLSSGVIFTPLAHREEVAKILTGVHGIDIVFWHHDDNKTISMQNSRGETAHFEYKSTGLYRYVPERGDPLDYAKMLKTHGYKPEEWLKDKIWKDLTYDEKYPDAGYRLYDAFFNLVKNPASIMFSNVKNYQFGAFITHIATWIKFGHKGTHGGLFKEPSQGVVMTNNNLGKPLPNHLRYNELFGYFLPEVTKAYKKSPAKKEVTVILTDEERREVTGQQ